MPDLLEASQPKTEFSARPGPALNSRGVQPKLDRKTGWRLFLDFDGVLNNDPFLRHQRNHVSPGEHRLFDPSNLLALDQLCSKLPVSDIVITSTWREGRSLPELCAMLKNEGSRSASLIADVTGASSTRADEISDFLLQQPHERWFILDDLSLGERFGTRFFKTSPARGLNPAMCEDLARVLQAESAQQP